MNTAFAMYPVLNSAGAINSRLRRSLGAYEFSINKIKVGISHKEKKWIKKPYAQHVLITRLGFLVGERESPTKTYLLQLKILKAISLLLKRSVNALKRSSNPVKLVGNFRCDLIVHNLFLLVVGDTATLPRGGSLVESPFGGNNATRL